MQPTVEETQMLIRLTNSYRKAAGVAAVAKKELDAFKADLDRRYPPKRGASERSIRQHPTV